MITTEFSKLMMLDVDAAGISAGRCVSSGHSLTRFTGDGRRTNLLCILERGEREYRVEGATPFVLHENEMIFIPITSCYASHAVGDGDCVWSFVDFNLMSGGEQLYVDEPFRILRDASKYADGLEKIRALGQSRLRAKAALFELLAEIAEKARERFFVGSEFSSIYEAVMQIEQHPERDFSVRELARMCCMSDTGFREKFKRYSGGMAPLDYRSRLRIERADELLRAGGFTVEHIAELLGFYDAAHFCRVYKRLRGHTPGGVTSPS